MGALVGFRLATGLDVPCSDVVVPFPGVPCSTPVNITVTFTSKWCAASQPFDFASAQMIDVDFPGGPPAATAYHGAAHQGCVPPL